MYIVEIGLMNEEILIDKEIKLNNAVMIIGLGGWGNAGEVSTFTVKYLTEKLSAKKFGEIPSERFHSYLIQRPIVSINQGIIESYIPPRNDLFYWKTEEKVDLVLLIGYEPHLNWTKYIKTVIRIATETGVERIYTIGGFLADIYHDSEIPIAASTNNEQLLAKLEEAGVELTNYKGPTSIYSELMWEAREKIDVISLWCAVPIYIKGLYPKAAYSMLTKIAKLVDLELDLKDLEEKAKSFKAQLEREGVDPDQLRDLINNLRRRSDRKDEPTYFV